MDKQQRLNQLNYHNEGYRLTEEQIVAEYNKMYKPEVTPWTNPELFDPLNPPEGWEYDAWHCVWCQIPSEQFYKAEMLFLKASVLITGVVMLWMIFK